jgi:hypothetical protein
MFSYILHVICNKWMIFLYLYLTGLTVCFTYFDIFARRTLPKDLNELRLVHLIDYVEFNIRNFCYTKFAINKFRSFWFSVSSLWTLAYCVQVSDIRPLPVLPTEVSVASPPSSNSSSTRDHHSTTFEVLKFCIWSNVIQQQNTLSAWSRDP